MWAIKDPDGIIDKDNDGIVAGDPDDAAEVISMSFGVTSYSGEVCKAIQLAYNYGIVLVAAAGNEDWEGVTYPAKFDEVIAVAAVDENDQVPDWISKGLEVELAAPGVNILSTIPKDRYDYYSGTLMAAPHISGTVGLMISRILAENRTYTIDHIRRVLRDTADDIGSDDWDPLSGYGVIRADLATLNA